MFVLLTVLTDLENKAAWKECLSVKGVRLPTGYFLGVTAATGDLSDNHDIISMRFYELDMPGDVSILDLLADRSLFDALPRVWHLRLSTPPPPLSTMSSLVFQLQRNYRNSFESIGSFNFTVRSIKYSKSSTK